MACNAVLIFTLVVFGNFVIHCAQTRKQEEPLPAKQQAESNSSTKICLPTVTVIRISSLREVDLGFRAARDVFHSLPRWNDRFIVKIRTYFTNRSAGQSTASALQLTLKALERPNQTYVAMLGPDFTSEGQSVAQINPIYNLNSVVMSGSDLLNNVASFPLLFRVTSPSSDAMKVLASLVNMLRIRRVSTLAFREVAYVQSVKSFAEYFVRHMNGTVEGEVVLHDDINSGPETNRLLTNDNNVDYIVTSIGENMRYVFCNVYKATSHWLLRPTFLSLDFRDVRDQWRPLTSNITNSFPPLNCTLDEMRAAFNGSVFVTYINPNYITDRAVLTRPRHDSVTLQQITQQVQQNSAKLNNTLPNHFTYFSYDGGFAMYTALYRVDKRMEDENFGGGIRLHQLDSKKTSPELWQKFASMLHDEMAATSFEGATIFKSTGRVTFDKNQGRTGGMELIQYQGVKSAFSDEQFTNSFVQIGLFTTDGKITLNTSLLKFHTDTGEAPHVWRQRYNKLHESNGKQALAAGTLAIVVAICVIVFIVAMAIAGFAWNYRRQKRVGQAQALKWLLANSSLQQQPSAVYANFSSRSASTSSVFSSSSKSKASTTATGKQHLVVIFLNTNARAFLRHVTVNVPVVKDVPDMNRIFEPAATLQRLTHENVNKFFGICLDYQAHPSSMEGESATPVVAFEYQEKKSLRAMLRQSNNNNKDWSIDRGLKLCFIADCIRGMRALHEAGVVHGFLHTGNVVVDTKLTCKITDYGLANVARSREELEPVSLANVREHLLDDDMLFNQKLAFRSPEQIRAGFHRCDVQKSDVYSTGMVVVEILTREPPQFVTLQQKLLTSKEVMEHRILSANEDDPLSPVLNSTDANIGLRTLVLECTNENPSKRPTISIAFKRLMQLPEFVSMVSVAESLAVRLQHHANDLEMLVSERTRALFEEANRTEQLLLQILPASVAVQLKAGRRVEPEYFECVSVYFSEIANFDAITFGTDNFTPMQTVKLLNSLYMTFDNVLAKFDVYKVETIGDAYMVASGLPETNERKHADELCRFSLEMLRITQNISSNAPTRESIEYRGAPIHLRIGLHCGPCMAGVIGISLPRYCLFGDTINTASRMQSTGQPNYIHCSSAMRTFAEVHFPGKFHWQARGEISVKGLGTVTTHWLVG